MKFAAILAAALAVSSVAFAQAPAAISATPKAPAPQISQAAPGAVPVSPMPTMSEDDIAKRQIDMYDLNKDGKVSLDEFLTRPKDMFKQLDANKDGNITVDELKKARAEQKAKMDKAMKDAQAKSGAAPTPTGKPAPAPQAPVKK